MGERLLVLAVGSAWDGGRAAGQRRGRDGDRTSRHRAARQAQARHVRAGAGGGRGHVEGGSRGGREPGDLRSGVHAVLDPGGGKLLEAFAAGGGPARSRRRGGDDGGARWRWTWGCCCAGGFTCSARCCARAAGERSPWRASSPTRCCPWSRPAASVPWWTAPFLRRRPRGARADGRERQLRQDRADVVIGPIHFALSHFRTSHSRTLALSHFFLGVPLPPALRSAARAVGNDTTVAKRRRAHGEARHGTAVSRLSAFSALRARIPHANGRLRRPCNCRAERG